MNVTVIGTGYVGLVVGACLAETGNRVVCADIDEAKIDALREARIPIYEPGLDRLVARNLAEGRLEFTTDVAEAVRHGRVVFIAVGTPPGEDGSADLQHVLKVAGTIGRNLNRRTEHHRRGRDQGQGRAREHRSQRPVLVRLGQEVQEVPRGLSAAALEFVRAFNDGDLDAFNEVLHDDVEIHSARGLREGRDAARAWATRAPGGVQQTIEVKDSSESDTEVLLTVERHWHWDEDGSHAATDELAWLFGFRDGKICSWRPFEDRGAARTAFEAEGPYSPELP